MRLLCPSSLIPCGRKRLGLDLLILFLRFLDKCERCRCVSHCSSISRSALLQVAITNWFIVWCKGTLCPGPSLRATPAKCILLHVAVHRSSCCMPLRRPFLLPPPTENHDCQLITFRAMIMSDRCSDPCADGERSTLVPVDIPSEAKTGW